MEVRAVLVSGAVEAADGQTGVLRFQLGDGSGGFGFVSGFIPVILLMHEGRQQGEIVAEMTRVERQDGMAVGDNAVLDDDFARPDPIAEIVLLEKAIQLITRLRFGRRAVREGDVDRRRGGK